MNQLAKAIVDIATGEVDGKRSGADGPSAAQRGRKGGLIGGRGTRDSTDRRGTI